MKLYKCIQLYIKIKQPKVLEDSEINIHFENLRLIRMSFLSLLIFKRKENSIEKNIHIGRNIKTHCFNTYQLLYKFYVII